MAQDGENYGPLDFIDIFMSDQPKLKESKIINFTSHLFPLRNDFCDKI